MTELEQLTEKLLRTIHQEDFEQVYQVLEQRDSLLASGAEVTASALESGNQACQALLALKQNLAAESSRLDQIRKIADPVSELASPLRDYFG